MKMTSSRRDLARSSAGRTGGARRRIPRLVCPGRLGSRHQAGRGARQESRSEDRRSRSDRARGRGGSGARATTVQAWTYNGGIPGPLIRARVGDRVIVHFTNDLPQPTTIHWHGVRVPIEMDGVPDISQPEVKRGETFTYDFVVRDAALYWYHPHVMSAAQVGFGLYGALLVEDPADDVGVADQLTIVLSDIGFNRNGVLEPADSGGPAGHGVRPRGHLHPGQRQDPADAARALRRAAALAHRQHRQEPVLSARVSMIRRSTSSAETAACRSAQLHGCCSSRPENAWTSS